jgi:hypothetical protein
MRMAGKHIEPHAPTDEDLTRVTVGDVRPLDGR